MLRAAPRKDKEAVNDSFIKFYKICRYMSKQVSLSYEIPLFGSEEFRAYPDRDKYRAC